MHENFADMLAGGGHANSLGRSAEVIELVLHDRSRMDELFDCLFHEDAWVRMRAADALEKTCRLQPEWLVPYIDAMQRRLATSPQASIQWHMAQIYRQVAMSSDQKQLAIDWLKRLLATTETDWIAASNAMDTLMQFTSDGSVAVSELRPLLATQQQHHSKAVVKRATKLLSQLNTNAKN